MNARNDTHSDTEDIASGESAVASDTAPTPTVELVGRTRQEEARLAVATATNLVEQGVSPSDIVIATADVDRYEDALTRATARYGHTLAVWTPLRVKRTVPYELIDATLRLLVERAQGAVNIQTLTEPLFLGWVPVTGRLEPLASAAINEIGRGHAGTDKPIEEWQATIAAGDIEHETKQDWMAYLNWIAAQPDAPTSKDIAETLNPVLERYDDACLPEKPGQRAVSELAATLRGFDRTTELLRMTRRRYTRWLATSRTDKQWDVVRNLLESFATTVPGKRELPTAAAIDVKEANDLWALSVPYVIAIGLVAEEWPTTPESPVPSAARTVIETTDIDGVRPHSAWTTARACDQFEVASNTATKVFVVTRHTTDANGVEKRPSPFLEHVETTRVSKAAQQRLITEPSVIPEPLSDYFPMETDDE